MERTMNHDTAWEMSLHLSEHIEEGIKHMEMIRDHYDLSDRQTVAVIDLIKVLKECEQRADYMVAII